MVHHIYKEVTCIAKEFRSLEHFGIEAFDRIPFHAFDDGVGNDRH